MKWVKALFILLLASAAAAQGAVAQTVQAVTFPGNSFLRNGALPVNVSASPQGIISVWYRASNISPGTSQLLMASYDATTRRPVLLLTIDNTVGDQWAGNGNHLLLSTTSGPTGSQFMTAFSATLIPYDGKWRHIIVTWDSSNWNGSTYALVGQLEDTNGSTPITWIIRPGYTGGGANPAPFSTPYYNGAWNIWTIGGYVDFNTNIPQEFYTGDAAEWFADVNVSDYTTILGLRSFSGFSDRAPISGHWGPLELGPLCTGPFLQIPPICLRGGPNTTTGFQSNLGRPASAFAVPSGYLALRTALDDPFSLYP